MMVIGGIVHLSAYVNPALHVHAVAWVVPCDKKRRAAFDFFAIKTTGNNRKQVRR